MDDFYKQHKLIRMHKVNNVQRERGIRLYSSQYGQCWELQLRAPLGIGGFGYEDGKDFVVANASLSRADMEALRDQIEVFLRSTAVTA